MAENRKPKTRMRLRLNLARFIPGRLLVVIRNWVEGGYATEMSKMRNMLPDGNGLALDIGLGTGETLSLFSEGNFVGLEIDERSLRIAAGKRPGRYVIGDAATLPFKDAAFSAIVMCKIGHHLDDKKLSAVANEALRILKEDGRLIFLDPEPPSKNTSFAHNFIAAIEAGNYHRSFEESASFFCGFRSAGVERFRKRGFDFYVAMFEK